MFFGKTTAPSAPNQTQNEAAHQPQSAAAASGPIFDVDASNFEALVLRGSMERPVIAYFTASWCGPCKQLGPVMDRTVQAAGGQVVMGRIDLDANQELAGALRIQSVPTVMAFFQGQPVDAFQGAVPESQVKAFVDKLVSIARQAQPDALNIPEALKASADALADERYDVAQAIYAQVLEQEENNVQAYVGLVRTYIASGHVEEAQAMVENAPEDISKDSAFSEAKTALELAQMSPSGDLSGLQAAVEKKPNDHQARFDLALALFASGQRAEAMDHLLELLSQKREWKEEAARHQMLKFFEAMGHADPLTMEYRRKLSTILFS